MKVLIINDGSVPSSYKLNRAEILAQNLSIRGHDITVLCAKPVMDCDLKKKGYESIKFYYVQEFQQTKLIKRGRQFLSIYFKLKEILKKQKFDVLRPIAFTSSYATINANKRYNYPIMSSMTDFYGDFYEKFGFPFPNLIVPLINRMEAEIMKNSDVVIVDSPSQRKLWEERGLDKKKGIVLPHGIPKMFDLKDSGKCERIIKRYNLLNSKILFFHGDISHIDGIDILIMATKKLIKKHSAVKVMIVGEGSKNYMNYLKQMIKEEDVRDNFIFTGWVPYVEIPDYISCADIYVAPFRLSHTSNTNIPNKLLEYIAMKKPIVATRSKGIQEMFGNLITYIDPESPDSLSNEILKLINNDRSSEDIDEKKEKLVEVYKWKYITRHEEKIMQSLIKNRNQDFRQFDWQKVIYPNL